MSLSAPITHLKGLGLRSAQKLNQFNIYTQKDLLFYFPYDYQDKTCITPLKDAIIGEYALVELQIEKVEKHEGTRRHLLCYLNDGLSKNLLLRFFHFNALQAEAFTRGQMVQCFGEILLGRRGLEMIHPQYRMVSLGQTPLLSKTFSPVYPSTLGINAFKLNTWIKEVLKTMQKEGLDDVLSSCMPNLPSLEKSILSLHYPKNIEAVQQIKLFQHSAQKRLIVEELCSQRLELLRLKKERKTQHAESFNRPKLWFEKLKKNLDFKLSNAQLRVIDEIYGDLKSKQTMLRLLQGDVGSGKTIVAIAASLAALNSGFQVAIMAPTEVLAEQHFITFNHHLSALHTCIVLLGAGGKTKHKQKILKSISNGNAHIVVGTHSLFQEQVTFSKLGFVIIDEQHKFGVHQRLMLTKKAKHTPHQLIMTATPIPRSLAMSAYANLDTSIIDELPPGRKPVKTIVISANRQDEIIRKIKQVCAQKKQVYWVCTLIEESETLGAQSAKNRLKYLKQNLAHHKIALIHGKILKHEKAEIMHAFQQKEIDVLLATTVIEVGIDVPNASLMVIENAERFGLAQLHQLRGRVGRGKEHSICILMYQKPLGDNAKQRLSVLRKNHDGFLIAQKDLELRGPGEVLGTEQTGAMRFKIANIVRDEYLLGSVFKLSNCMLEQPESAQKKLLARWRFSQKAEYGNA